MTWFKMSFSNNEYMDDSLYFSISSTWPDMLFIKTSYHKQLIQDGRLSCHKSPVFISKTNPSPQFIHACTHFCNYKKKTVLEYLFGSNIFYISRFIKRSYIKKQTFDNW